MTVEITRGWDGETFESLGENLATGEAYDKVREWAAAHPECGPLREFWTHSFIGGREVVDYGSHTHFGRIVGEVAP